MAKSALRLEAIRLRKSGDSVRSIALKLRVAKSTASLWTKHISLTIKQLERLHQRVIHGGELGRLRGALIQKERRVKKYLEEGLKIRNLIGKLSSREKLLIGAALYWAEGTKKGRKVDFCNSDPYLVKFMVNWFKKQFDIKNDEFRVQLGINESHTIREQVVKEYWSHLTGISLSQFTKTSFKHAKLKKVYENFDEYYGTPKIYVSRPARIHPKILGLIDSLKMAT